MQVGFMVGMSLGAEVGTMTGLRGRIPAWSSQPLPCLKEAVPLHHPGGSYPARLVSFMEMQYDIEG